MGGLRVLQNQSILTSEFAYDTSATAIDLGSAKGYSIVINHTVTTPAAFTFAADTDVNTTTNVITETAHGMKDGLKGQVSSTGTVPAGLSASTDYYVIVVNADSFKLATSLANAQAGTAIDITDVGTAASTHTFTPTTLAGCQAKLYASNDGSNFIVVPSVATNITSTSTILFNIIDPMYRYVKLTFVLTAGQISVTNYFCSKG